MEEQPVATPAPAPELMALSDAMPVSASSPTPPTVEPLSRPPSTTGAPAAAGATTEPISRQSPTSTPTSAFQQLARNPSSHATPNPPNYQQPLASKAMPLLPHNDFARSSPASTLGPGGNSVPTCQNCQTSTTPLWRRDELGSVLCNACGLFLKLHGRPRPSSLKTDVIKSRNRVKTSRNELAKQKKAPTFPPVSDIDGADNPGANLPAGAAGLGARRPSARSANGHAADDNSPISRTATPNMYSMVYPDMDGSQFQGQAGMAFAMSAADGRVATELNGDHPPTQETILAENASLKTRVSELEVIQELYRGRLQQLENDETQLRNELEESHRRENMLKRRLDEMELELKAAKGSASPTTAATAAAAAAVAAEPVENGRPAKKARLEEDVPTETGDVKPEVPEEAPAAAAA